MKIKSKGSIINQFAFFAGCFLILYLLFPKKQQTQKNEITYILNSNSSKPRMNYLLIVALILLSTVSLGSGLYIHSLTQSLPQSSVDELPIFHVSAFYDPKVNFPRVPIEDIEINILLDVREKDNKIYLVIHPKDKKVRSQNIALNYPRLGFAIPGRIESIGNVPIEQSYYDGVTRIAVQTNETESMYWLNSVQKINHFQKRVVIRMGNRIDPYSEPDGWDKSYTVTIKTRVPSNDKIVYQSATSLENIASGYLTLGSPIWVGERAFSGPRGGYRVIQATSNFELIFEDKNADSQRNLMLIMVGILFGLAGNFVSGLIIYLLSGNQENAG